MKLSKYIHGKMGPSNAITWRARTEEQIEKWIVDWYNDEFKWNNEEKQPPMWLADWRKYV